MLNNKWKKYEYYFWMIRILDRMIYMKVCCRPLPQKKTKGATRRHMQIFDEYSFVTWNWWANEYMYIYVGMNTISQQNTYCELKLSLAIFTPKLNVIYILNRWTMILKNSSCTVSDLSTLNNPCFSVHEVHCVSLRYYTVYNVHWFKVMLKCTILWFH